MSLDPINRPLPEDTLPREDAPRADKKERREAASDVAEVRRIQQLSDLATVLSTDEGRRVLLRVIGHANIYEYRTDHADAVSLARREGQRQSALWLIDEIMHVRPDTYPNLLLYNAKLAREQQEYRAGVDMAAARKP